MEDHEHGRYIYFIQSGDATKIGLANNPTKRMAELQTSNPVQLVMLKYFRSYNADRDERVLHGLVHDRCIRGEWFVLDELTRDDIKTAETLVEATAILAQDRKH